MSIKREILDERNERLSPPSSTGSYSSDVSISHASGPIADIVRQHRHHDTNPTSEQQHHQRHQQQQELDAAVARSAVFFMPQPNNNTAIPTGYLLPCPLCDAPLEPRLFRQHLDRHYPRDSPVCPVLQCGRRFAHPNSVRNHMRIKHTLQWAKMKAMRSSGGPFSGMPDFK